MKRYMVEISLDLIVEAENTDEAWEIGQAITRDVGKREDVMGASYAGVRDVYLEGRFTEESLEGRSLGLADGWESGYTQGREDVTTN